MRPNSPLGNTWTMMRMSVLRVEQHLHSHYLCFSVCEINLNVWPETCKLLNSTILLLPIGLFKIFSGFLCL